MNFLKEYTHLYGEMDSPQQNWTTQDFLKLRTTISHKLGEKAYLLDDYIANFLKSTNTILINNAVSESGIITSDLWRICISIVRGEETEMKHSFYKNAKHFMDTTNFPFQEETTKTEYCFVHLFDSFLLESVKEFKQNLEERSRQTIDIIYLRQSYTNIISILKSETEMEQLNSVLKQKFLYVTPVSAFIQRATHELVDALCQRDIETGKRIFQLECKD